MGNFLVLVPAVGAEIDPVFDAGLGIASSWGWQPTSGDVRRDWGAAARFPRADGSGTPIVRDRRSDSWILTVGTWFAEGIPDAGSPAGDERLLQRYLEDGAVAVADQLEGFFVVVIGDGRHRDVRVITDLAGACRCHVRSLPSALALSGSSLLLARLHRFAELDPVGAQELLFGGTIFERRTLFRDVEKVGPAEIVRFAGGERLDTRRYWTPEAVPLSALDGEDALDVLDRELTRTAERVGERFGRPACDLTGGYDSRALVAAFCEVGVPITAVVTGPEDSDDVRISRRVAAEAEVPHRHVAPKGPEDLQEVSAQLPLTDGEFDLVEYARIARVHRTMASECDASVNGSYTDLVRGIWWHLATAPIGRRVPVDPRRVAERRYAVARHDPGIVRRKPRLDLAEHVTGVVARTLADARDLPNSRQLDVSYLKMRMQSWQGRIATSTDRIWPCLSPYMLRSILEPTLEMSPRIRGNNLLIRIYLARRHPELASVPLAYGHPAEPLGWRNLPRFLPYVARNARKAVEKALSSAGIDIGRHRPSGPREDRLRLWQDPAVRDLLRPERMAAVEAGLLDPDALEGFLERSRRRDFPYDRQWSRLLTLELALLSCRGRDASSPIKNPDDGPRERRRG